MSGSEGIEVPSGEMIREVSEEGYKYLGVLQECKVKNKQEMQGKFFRKVSEFA